MSHPSPTDHSSSHTPTTPKSTEHSTTHSTAANKYRPALLEPQHYKEYWSTLQPMLERVANEFPGHNLQTLLSALVDPNIRMYCLAVMLGDKVKALIGVELIETAIGERELHIIFVTGREVKKWFADVEPVVLAWAKSHGCIRAKMYARKAMRKLLLTDTWRESHVLLETEL